MPTDEETLPLRARKKQRARRQILAAADRLIRTRGFDETKMRDIARAAELSYQTLYNYFPTKGDILRTLLTEQVEDLARRFETLLSGWEGDLLETLDALSTVSFAVVADGDRNLWRIAAVELLQQTEDATPVFALIDEMAHDMLKRVLVLARNRGELSDDAHLPTLGNVLFDLADYALLRFILEPGQTVEAALSGLSGKIRLVVSPYLTQGMEDL